MSPSTLFIIPQLAKRRQFLPVNGSYFLIAGSFPTNLIAHSLLVGRGKCTLAYCFYNKQHFANVIAFLCHPAVSPYPLTGGRASDEEKCSTVYLFRFPILFLHTGCHKYFSSIVSHNLYLKKKVFFIFFFYCTIKA